MATKPMLKLSYVWLALQGLFSLVAPRKAIKLATMGWRAGFENVGELEPREWYVEMARALGAGMLVAGATGLLLQKSGDSEETDEEEEESEFDESSDDDPVEVDVD